MAQFSVRTRPLFAIVVSTLLLPTSITLGATVDVWVDPGHGGDDGGAPGFSGQSDAREKVLAYEVSSVLSSRLGQVGYSSLKTRNGDNYPTLQRRAQMSHGQATNDSGQIAVGQMFISIHMNSNKSATPFGTETYFPSWKTLAFTLDAYRVDSTFAAAIHSGLMTGGSAPLAFLGCHNNRGVKRAGHYVTTRSGVPATLVEVCFISNQCQQSKIEAQGNQALIANGIAVGVSNVIVPGGGRSGGKSDFTSPSYPEQPPTQTHYLGSGSLHGSATQGQSLTEGFESGVFPPPGWSIQTASQPYPHLWHRIEDPLYAHGGAAGARVGAQSSVAIDEWLISPVVSLSSGHTGLRFFWNGNRNHAQAVNATCSIRQTGTSQWIQVWSLQSEPPGTVFRYQERVIDITPWIGTNIQVAFRATGTNGAEFVVDDVDIGAYEATGPPTNDTCSGAKAIAAGTNTFTGSTCYASNSMDARDLPGGCTVDSLRASDVFYWVSAAAGDTLTATVEGPWSPILYLVSDCSTGAQCLDATPTWQDGDVSIATLQHVFSSQGVYFLVLDGVTGECGDFQLTTQIRSPITGVEEVGAHAMLIRFVAYPNPSGREVKLRGEFAPGLDDIGELRIYDISGRLVSQRSVHVYGGHTDLVWDGRSSTGTRVSSGIYVASLKVGRESLSTRFILQR